MKSIFYSTLILLLFTVSHAFRFETDPNNHNHDETHVESNGQDSLIRLPIQTIPATHLTQPSHLKPVPFTGRIIKLRFMLSRRPIQTRCRHRFGLSSGILLHSKEDDVIGRHGEVILPRHVARKQFDHDHEIELKGEFEGEHHHHRRHHRHRHHHDHDHKHHDHDRDEGKKEEGVMKQIRKFLSRF